MRLFFSNRLNDYIWWARRNVCLTEHVIKHAWEPGNDRDGGFFIKVTRYTITFSTLIAAQLTSQRKNFYCWNKTYRNLRKALCYREKSSLITTVLNNNEDTRVLLFPILCHMLFASVTADFHQTVFWRPSKTTSSTLLNFIGRTFTKDLLTNVSVFLREPCTFILKINFMIISIKKENRTNVHCIFC